MIETQRLILREFDWMDASALHEIAWRPGFDFYSLNRKIDTAREFVRVAMEQRERPLSYQTREKYKLAVCLKEDPAMCIGYVALDDIQSPAIETPDIGYLIDPNHQGRGYATEAMRGLINYCYSHIPSLNHLWLTVHPGNYASQHVAGNLSFEPVSDEVFEKPYGPRYVYLTNRQRLSDTGVITCVPTSSLSLNLK